MRFTPSPGQSPMRIATGIALALFLFGGTISASADTPAGVSISIDDGLTEVDSEQEIEYRSELRNSGPAAVEATVVLTAADYIEVTSVAGSDVEGSIIGGTVAWPVTVEPGEIVTLLTIARIGAIPIEERRVTTVVSVYLASATSDDWGAPLIRSADSNRIIGLDDADADADADAEPNVSAAKPSASPALTIVLVSIGGISVLLGAAAALAISRRRRRRAQD